MTYFVTETYIKVRTAITANAQSDDIIPFVATASDMWAQPILGSYFYDIILTKYNAETLTANEILLVEKMKPGIAWRAASDAVLSLTVALKNKGLQKQNSDNSESVGDETIGFVMDHYTQKAINYEGFLIAWLKENRLLFADFISDANNDSIIKPQKGNNYNGFFDMV